MKPHLSYELDDPKLAIQEKLIVSQLYPFDKPKLFVMVSDNQFPSKRALEITCRNK